MHGGVDRAPAKDTAALKLTPDYVSSRFSFAIRHAIAGTVMPVRQSAHTQTFW
jgi:hypothetical protein